MSPIELRMAFDAALHRASAVDLPDDPAGAAEAAHRALAELATALDLASQLSGGQQSVQHGQVMLEVAEVTAALGHALGDEARLREALERCDRALSLLVALGSPMPRLEAQGLCLRGNLLGTLGDLDAGIQHLEEVVAVMQPAVEHLEAMRERGDPAELAMLDMTREDALARELLDSATGSLAAMRDAAAARNRKPWWKLW